jgi:CRP/FNR family transcriptional regulator
MQDSLPLEEEPRSCRECGVRQHGICSILDVQQLTALALQTRTVRHDIGTELFGDDTQISSYANIMKGVVKLFKILEDGRQQVVGLKFPPDFVGRLRGLDNQVGAQAASEVEVCHIPRRVFDALMEENRALEKHMLELALIELDEAREWMVTLGRKTASERVASFLYSIALHVFPDLIAHPRQVELDLPVTRSEIADFLGLSLETVSRQITLLRRANIIAVTNKRHVTINQPEELRLRCG